jgi:hypothetical protein
MNPNPEEKSSNEPERLRAELQRQRQTLDAVMERLKAQEELTRDAWEVLAVTYRKQQQAEREKAQASPEDVVSNDENTLFFTSLMCMRHDDRIKAGLESLRSHSKK